METFGCCTPGCLESSEKPQNDHAADHVADVSNMIAAKPADPLAALVAGLSASDRARLAALLRENGGG